MCDITQDICPLYPVPAFTHGQSELSLIIALCKPLLTYVI